MRDNGTLYGDGGNTARCSASHPFLISHALPYAGRGCVRAKCVRAERWTRCRV